MLPRAVTARVAYVPGTGFYADGFGSRRSMRLSLLLPDPGADPRGRPAAGGGDRGRAGRACRRSARGRPRPSPWTAGHVAGHRRAPPDSAPDRGRPMSDDRPARTADPATERTPRSSCWPAVSPTNATCRCAPGAAVAEALRRRRRRRRVRDVDAGLLPAAHGPARRRRHRPARRRRARTARSGRCWICSASRSSAPRPTACRLALDKPIAKAELARAGLDTPDWVALPHDTFRELGAGAVLDAMVERAGAAADASSRPGRLRARRAGGHRRRRTCRPRW